MTSTNHLAGKSGYTHELLQELTDAELDDQEAFFREHRDWNRDTPDPKPPKSRYASHAYAAYRYDIELGYIHRERERRHSSAPVDTSGN